jgi:hypothetical protein
MSFCFSRAENTSLNRYQKKGSVQKKGEEEEGGGDQCWDGYQPTRYPRTSVRVPESTLWEPTGMAWVLRLASFPLTSSRTRRFYCRELVK